MFAIIKTGGKQYRVAANDVLKVEKLPAEEGSTVTFDEVLLVGDDKGQSLGTPLVKGASVSATVLDQTRAGKIIVFKKKRRKNYRRTKGHRQHETVVRITEILTGGTKRAAAEKAAPKKAVATPSQKTADGSGAVPKKAAPKKAVPKRAGSEKKPAAKKAAPNKAAAKKSDTRVAGAAIKDEGTS